MQYVGRRRCRHNFYPYMVSQFLGETVINLWGVTGDI